MEQVIINDANSGHSLAITMSPEMIERCRADQEYLRNIVMQYTNHNTDDPEVSINNSNPRNDESESIHLENQDSRNIVMQYTNHNTDDPEVSINNSNPRNDESESIHLENQDNIYRWRDSNILHLLSLYEENHDKLEDPKLSKKKFWELIASRMMTPLTGLQCMTKFKALQKYYKSVKDHNARSGSDKKHWKYYDRMDEIFGHRAWATPVAIVSSDPAGNTVTHLNDEHSYNSGPTPSPGSSSAPSVGEPRTRKRNMVDAKLDSITELIKKKISQKEEHEKNKERRHKELLDMLRTL